MTTRVARNGQSELQSALAQMLRNQAVFVSHLDEDRQRFARIERDLDEIKALLRQHDRILKDLPAAIQKKIGFHKN